MPTPAVTFRTLRPHKAHVIGHAPPHVEVVVEGDAPTSVLLPGGVRRLLSPAGAISDERLRTWHSWCVVHDPKQGAVSGERMSIWTRVHGGKDAEDRPVLGLGHPDLGPVFVARFNDSTEVYDLWRTA